MGAPMQTSQLTILVASMADCLSPTFGVGFMSETLIDGCDNRNSYCKYVIMQHQRSLDKYDRYIGCFFPVTTVPPKNNNSNHGQL